MSDGHSELIESDSGSQLDGFADGELAAGEPVQLRIALAFAELAPAI